jgi:FtsP/CotA-like multicopper oxidase with cupredoxin domain
VLNGKSFPATTPIVAKQGDWVLIHMANDGSMLHPMHLHGYHFEVVAQDGFPLEQPYMADTLVIAPGQRFDVLIHAIYPAPGRSTATSFPTSKARRACTGW